LGIFGFEKNPLELSGSYKSSAKEQGNAKYTSDFINAGLYYRFYKKFGLTLGYQQINSDLNLEAANAQKAQMANLKVAIVPIVKSVQNQWMAGIDYTVAKNAWLSINYGIMNAENTYNIRDFVDGDGKFLKDKDEFGRNFNSTNLPGYIVINGTEAGKQELKHEFSRNILEATINVEF